MPVIVVSWVKGQSLRDGGGGGRLPNLSWSFSQSYVFFGCGLPTFTTPGAVKCTT